MRLSFGYHIFFNSSLYVLTRITSIENILEIAETALDTLIPLRSFFSSENEFYCIQTINNL